MKIATDVLTIKAGKRNNLSNPITSAFHNIRQGIQASGHELVEPEDADVVFVFGSITDRKLDTERAKRITLWRSEGKTIFSLDSAFFSTYLRNRFGSSETFFFRVGLNDCTGEGDFLNENSTNDRYEWFKKAFAFEEKEVKVDNDAPILFILQSEKGWMYNNPEPYYEYARGVVDKIRKFTTRKIILRGHPNTDRNPIHWIGKGFDHIEYSHCERDRRSLFGDLSRSGCVVTHSSSAAVESIVEGIPTFTLDPRGITYKHSMNNLCKINDLGVYNRDNQILNDWAMTSWHVDEMKDPKWINYYMSKIK